MGKHVRNQGILPTAKSCYWKDLGSSRGFSLALDLCVCSLFSMLTHELKAVSVPTLKQTSRKGVGEKREKRNSNNWTPCRSLLLFLSINATIPMIFFSDNILINVYCLLLKP